MDGCFGPVMCADGVYVGALEGSMDLALAGGDAGGLVNGEKEDK